MSSFIGSPGKLLELEYLENMKLLGQIAGKVKLQQVIVTLPKIRLIAIPTVLAKRADTDTGRDRS
ncbi:MAG: hypothetical protein WD045_15010 [Pirellulaceae bacterium]